MECFGIVSEALYKTNRQPKGPQIVVGTFYIHKEMCSCQLVENYLTKICLFELHILQISNQETTTYNPM